MCKIYFQDWVDLQKAVSSILPFADIDLTQDNQIVIYTNLMTNDDNAIVEWEDD